MQADYRGFSEFFLSVPDVGENASPVRLTESVFVWFFASLLWVIWEVFSAYTHPCMKKRTTPAIRRQVIHLDDIEGEGT